MTNSTKRCKALKVDGASQCRAAALPKSEHCFFHEPAKAAERREAQASGGRTNRPKTLGAETPDAKIQDCRDALALISETISQVRRGQIDPRVANSIGFLASIAMRAFEQGNLENRIAKLERLLIKSNNSVSDFTLTGAENGTFCEAETTK
jgi:hypothetical protein